MNLDLVGHLNNYYNGYDILLSADPLVDETFVSVYKGERHVQKMIQPCSILELFRTVEAMIKELEQDG